MLITQIAKIQKSETAISNPNAINTKAEEEEESLQKMD